MVLAMVLMDPVCFFLLDVIEKNAFYLKNNFF